MFSSNLSKRKKLQKTQKLGRRHSYFSGNTNEVRQKVAATQYDCSIFRFFFFFKEGLGKKFERKITLCDLAAETPADHPKFLSSSFLPFLTSIPAFLYIPDVLTRRT